MLILLSLALFAQAVLAQEGGGPTAESLTSGLVVGAFFGILVAFGGVIICMQLKEDVDERDLIFNVVCCQSRKRANRTKEDELEKVIVETENKTPPPAQTPLQAPKEEDEVEESSSIEFSRDVDSAGATRSNSSRSGARKASAHSGNSNHDDESVLEWSGEEVPL